jgi:acyl-CoA synthetase (AMP-forming)/AMP-acid ligase II
VDEFDLSSLKFIGCGAAPLGADVQLECSSRLRIPVIQGYGMTEASGPTQVCPVEAINKNKPGAVGLCAPNIKCKVIDPLTSRELGPNERGELWLSGPQMMKGYLNNPSATAECLDREGWYHTGDIGYADEDGYFYIVDRLKELIKYKGYQVAPAELEAILLTHPAIAEAAVIPKADPDVGEVPKAFLVAKGPVSPEEVMNFVAARVAPYKKIRCVEFVEQLPKSPVGKLLRRVLRDRDSGQANPN